MVVAIIQIPTATDLTAAAIIQIPTATDLIAVYISRYQLLKNNSIVDKYLIKLSYFICKVDLK